MSTVTERKKQLKNQVLRLGRELLQNPDKVVEAAAMGGCGYLGYQAEKKLWPESSGLNGIIVGLVGYKLATTDGGMPPVSQIAGLATLGIIGLGIAGSGIDFNKIFKDAAENLLNSVGWGTYGEDDKTTIEEHKPIHPVYVDPVRGYTCPVDYVLGRHPSMMCWYAPPIGAGEPVDPWIDSAGLIYCPVDWGYKYDAATKTCVKP